MISNRLAGIRRRMADRGINGLLVTSRQNVFYLSGFDGSSGDLLITLDAAYILCDFRYSQQAKEQASLYIAMDVAKGIYTVIGSILANHGITHLGIEDRELSLAAYNGMRKLLAPVLLVPVADMISSMRIVKDDIEIEQLATAAKISDLAFESVLGKIRAGVSETDIAAEIEYVMRKNGASGPSFDTIVASGANSAKPHGVAGGRKLENGDLVVMDFGCKYGGYCSDMTRTVAIGDITPKQRNVYQMVLFTQLKMLHLVEAGRKCCDMDRISRNVLASFGYAQYFGHSLGHGVGLDIHEAPSVSSKGEHILAPGMMVTVEPGVYLDGEFGVRIEDSVIIEERGIRILSKSTKELMIL